MKRMPPVDPARWSDAARNLLGEDSRPVERDAPLAEADGAPPNILFTIAEHPALLEPFLGFSATLALQGALERRDSEILALRASWNCRSRFEWGHHVEYGRAHGLSATEIDDLAKPLDAGEFEGRDRWLIAAADQLHAHQRVEDETWQRLAAEFSPAQLVEIPFVVGHYTMLSMVANSTDVPLEPGYPDLPSE